MWTAPGIWPSSHSSCSRTSIQAAPSIACASTRVDLVDLGLDLLEKFPVARHGFKNDSSADRAFPLPWRQALVCRVPRNVDASTWSRSSPRRGRCRGRRRRDHPRDAARRRTSRRPSRASRRVPRNLPDAVRPADRAGLQGLAEGQHRRRCSGSGCEYPKNAQSCSSTAGIALLWAGLSERRAGRARAREEARPRHDHRRCRPTTCSTRRTSSPRCAELPDLPADAAEPRCSSRARGCRRRGTSISAERLYQRAARAEPERRRGAGRRRRRAASTRTTSTPAFSRLGPLTQRFPRSQSVRYYLGLLLAWTGQRDASLDAVQEGRRARPDDRARQVRRRVRRPGHRRRRPAPR